MARQRGTQVARTAGSVGTLALHPDRLPGTGADLVDMARSAVRQLTVDGRRSPLWTERSLERWFGTTRLSLEDVRSAAHALDGSVNDLFVAGAASRGIGVPRRGRPAGGRVAGVHAGEHPPRPVGPVATPSPPPRRWWPPATCRPPSGSPRIHDSLTAVKDERALGSMESAASAINLLPTAALVRTGQRLAGSVDFVCSNVRGRAVRPVHRRRRSWRPTTRSGRWRARRST